MTYIVNLCFRAKGKRDYEHIVRVDIGKPLTRKPEHVISCLTVMRFACASTRTTSSQPTRLM